MSDKTNPISLEDASADELTQLPGIGPATAERIVAYREENGFDDIEELLQVRGIGRGTFDTISPLVSLDAAPTVHPAPGGRFSQMLAYEFLREPELVELFDIRGAASSTPDSLSGLLLESADGDGRSVRRVALPTEATQWLITQVSAQSETPEWQEKLVATLDEADSDEERYRVACQLALCQALRGHYDEAFERLRDAAAVNDDWARHHHIYGLIHGARDQIDQATFELGQARTVEPFPTAQQRIERAVEHCM